MKSFKLFIVVMLSAAVIMISCKGKSAKELIVNKWQLTSVVEDKLAEGTEKISEERKKEMIGKMTLEFGKDGKFIVSGLGETAKVGTYAVSEDGKTVSFPEGETKTDPLTIDELTSTKLSLTDPKIKGTMIFSPK